MNIDGALREGFRGLPGGSSLRLVLGRRVGVRTVLGGVLTEEMILAWADTHHTATGKWPTFHSPEVIAAVGRKWAGVDQALRRGLRGLPGGDSLRELLARHGRPVKVVKRPPNSKA